MQDIVFLKRKRIKGVDMLKRKIYDSLSDWKKSKQKECLLVKGARQVGKTFIIRQFGQTEYRSFIEINFQKQSSLKTIFEGDRSAEEICKRMTANLKRGKRGGVEQSRTDGND